MQRPFTILVTDTNRHVRNLLRRELDAEGYEVEVARDGRELLERLGRDPVPDLLILDPDLQDTGGLAVLERLREGTFSIPVVLHGFSSEVPAGPDLARPPAAFIEKTEDTDVLKRVVKNVLTQCYASRIASRRTDGELAETEEESEIDPPG